MSRPDCLPEKIIWSELNDGQRAALKEWARKEYADLSWANLKDADLSWANLSGANLSEANLRGANLSGANLSGANLSGANLSWANLSGANLSWANLKDADLRAADLRAANLRAANLRAADLRNADLSDVKYNHLTIGIQPAPEGTLIGWKKCHTASGNTCIIKLEIPAEAQRSCATTRKHRAEFVKVLEAPEGAYSMYGVRTSFITGEIVRPDSWDDNRWNECSHGIHFFLDRAEAEAWDN